MPSLSDPTLIIVAAGSFLFISSAVKIFAAECRHQMELHLVQVRAMEIRNAYARQILSLREGRETAVPGPVARIEPRSQPSGEAGARAA